jgi:deazaflavin-dependent oxidoreductase (nitroreductase family)
MLLKLMMSPTGLAFDRWMVRWTGNSPLCRTFARMGGFPPRPALLLVVTGRKTGQKRESALPYFEIDRKLFVVGSRGGGPVDPQWVTNLRANPNATIFIARKPHRVKARISSGDERKALWDQLVRLVPTYADYQKLTTRELPLVIFE